MAVIRRSFLIKIVRVVRIIRPVERDFTAPAIKEDRVVIIGEPGESQSLCQCPMPDDFTLEVILPENLIEHDFDVMGGVPVAVIVEAAGLFEDASHLSGRRERLRARAPLRTVRESFPSHGSSQTKAPPDEEDPRARGPLGNTETWPLCAGLHWAAAPGRTKRQASLVICSSRLRRFHIL